jgi:hypothetical protein
MVANGCDIRVRSLIGGTVGRQSIFSTTASPHRWPIGKASHANLAARIAMPLGRAGGGATFCGLAPIPGCSIRGIRERA